MDQQEVGPKHPVTTTTTHNSNKENIETLFKTKGDNCKIHINRKEKKYSDTTYRPQPIHTPYTISSADDYSEEMSKADCFSVDSKREAIRLPPISFLKSQSFNKNVNVRSEECVDLTESLKQTQPQESEQLRSQLCSSIETLRDKTSLIANVNQGDKLQDLSLPPDDVDQLFRSPESEKNQMQPDQAYPVSADGNGANNVVKHQSVGPLVCIPPLDLNRIPCKIMSPRPHLVPKNRQSKLHPSPQALSSDVLNASSKHPVVNVEMQPRKGGLLFMSSKPNMTIHNGQTKNNNNNRPQKLDRWQLLERNEIFVLDAETKEPYKLLPKSCSWFRIFSSCMQQQQNRIGELVDPLTMRRFYHYAGGKIVDSKSLQEYNGVLLGGKNPKARINDSMLSMSLAELMVDRFREPRQLYHNA